MSKTVLIVDDEPTILRLLEFVLSKNYDVILKSNGFEAIHWIEEGNKPDLIILDVKMPYLNGVEFLKSIKVSGLYSSVPVIVLTGAYNFEQIESELSLMANKVMKKPFNPTILKDAIKSLLYPNYTTSALS